MKTFLFSLLSMMFAPLVFAQSATITWTTTYQTIDGWGASTGYAERNPNLTSSQADLFFSPTAGIGLAFVRVQDAGSGTSTPDLLTLQEAVARGAKVFVSFSSPLNGASADWSSNTAYIIAKVQYLQSNGVPVSYISPQNEPQDTGLWTAAQFDGFISTSLVPGMKAAGLSIPIVLGEDVLWFTNDWVTPCMNDASCTQYVPVVAGHDYGGANGRSTDGFPSGWQCCAQYSLVPVPSSAAGKRVWQTEINGGASGPCASDSSLANYDPSISDALVWAHNIHDFLTVPNGSAWMFWNLQAESVWGPPSCNDGLTDSNFNPAMRFYAVGNWSKYVRPGWVRIDATMNPAPGIYVTAFKEASSGNFAIVAINQNSSSANVSFSLSAFPSVTSVTPTVTAAGLKLVDQANVTVSSGAFSYSLPATSVTTFHASASSSSSSQPNPPAGLTAAVH
jgi:glucuronoarabinoxylan endo-1,4-beta-xylanase